MKITAIAMSRIPAPNANGIQVMKVCQALTQLGHDVTLLVPDMQPQRPSRAELGAYYGLRDTFEVRWLGTATRRGFTWRAVRTARRSRPDLIYTWSPQSAVFALLHHIPLIYEMHEPPLGRFGPFWYRAFLRTSGRKRLVSITRALADIVQEKYGLPSETILAPNGIDPSRYETLPSPALARRELGISAAPTVVCTGHLYAGRGAETFLALAQKSPQTQFVWVGGRQAEVRAWRGRASAAGADNAHFIGFIPNGELPLWQAAADVLIAPYGREIAGSSGGNSASVASPMKIFDYMAARRAIICSDLPVIREVLNEQSALFCPPDDTEAWHAALTRLLGDAALREHLAENAYRQVGGHTWVARQEIILENF
jgi:glycosyltransferase involved in cell wall biosynthesis